LALSALPRPR